MGTIHDAVRVNLREAHRLAGAEPPEYTNQQIEDALLAETPGVQGLLEARARAIMEDAAGRIPDYGILEERLARAEQRLAALEASVTALSSAPPQVVVNVPQQPPAKVVVNPPEQEPRQPCKLEIVRDETGRMTGVREG